MGRIGRAIARRLDGFGVPVVYHSRSPQPGVAYKHYPEAGRHGARRRHAASSSRRAGRRPGTSSTPKCSTRSGPRGIVINMSRGTVVDDAALIKALKEQEDLRRRPRRVRQRARGAAGSISNWTTSCCSRISAPPRSTPARRWSNWWSTTSWPGRAGKPPLTPVPETPWPPQEAGVIICRHDPSRPACIRSCWRPAPRRLPRSRADPPVSMPEPAVTEPPPPAAPRTMVGSWEFSNADREKTCAITFRNESSRVGKRVEFDPACAGHFPSSRRSPPGSSATTISCAARRAGQSGARIQRGRERHLRGAAAGRGHPVHPEPVRARARAQDRRADHRRMVGRAPHRPARSAG